MRLQLKIYLFYEVWGAVVNIRATITTPTIQHNTGNQYTAITNTLSPLSSTSKVNPLILNFAHASRYCLFHCFRHSAIR
jgi:hypothetical protein